MTSTRELCEQVERDAAHWRIHLMNFVDDFRRQPDLQAVAEPCAPGDERIAAVIAATVEQLCDEAGLRPPAWTANIPACKRPFFVSGLENLKAIALAESPLWFRRRKVFVLSNFLHRA